MNGRVYDYNLGRFLSVDPFIHGSSQGINPYSYIMNNPLAGTDPTGYTPRLNELKDRLGVTPFSLGNVNSSDSIDSVHVTKNSVMINTSNGSVQFSGLSEKQTQGMVDILSLNSIAKQNSELESGTSVGGINLDSLFSYTQNSFDELQTSIADTWSQLDGVDKGKLLEESTYLVLNSLGTVAGGIMLALPEPTTATKWLGGALFAKSSTGAALNIANIREAWSGGDSYVPSSLAALVTDNSSNGVKAVANTVDLAIDFASGRAAANAVIKHIPLTGKYGTSRHLTEAVTVQKYMGGTAEKFANGLTAAQSLKIMHDSKKSIERNLQ